MTLEAYPNDARTRPHTTITVDASALGATSSDSNKSIVVFGSAEAVYLVHCTVSLLILKHVLLLRWGTA